MLYKDLDIIVHEGVKNVPMLDGHQMTKILFWPFYLSTTYYIDFFLFCCHLNFIFEVVKYKNVCQKTFLNWKFIWINW